MIIMALFALVYYITLAYVYILYGECFRMFIHTYVFYYMYTYIRICSRMILALTIYSNNNIKQHQRFNNDFV